MGMMGRKGLKEGERDRREERRKKDDPPDYHIIIITEYIATSLTTNGFTQRSSLRAITFRP